MITYEHANSIGDRDNWIVFWPQCRILQVNWMFPDPEEEGNKVHIRWIYDPDKIEDWPEDETPVMQRTDVHPNTECFRAFQESFPEMTDEEIRHVCEEAKMLNLNEEQIDDVAKILLDANNKEVKSYKDKMLKEFENH